MSRMKSVTGTTRSFSHLSRSLWNCDLVITHRHLNVWHVTQKPMNTAGECIICVQHFMWRWRQRRRYVFWPRYESVAVCFGALHDDIIKTENYFQPFISFSEVKVFQMLQVFPYLKTKPELGSSSRVTRSKMLLCPAVTFRGHWCASVSDVVQDWNHTCRKFGVLVKPCQLGSGLWQWLWPLPGGSLNNCKGKRKQLSVSVCLVQWLHPRKEAETRCLKHKKSAVCGEGSPWVCFLCLSVSYIRWWLLLTKHLNKALGFFLQWGCDSVPAVTEGWQQCSLQDWVTRAVCQHRQNEPPQDRADKVLLALCSCQILFGGNLSHLF